MFNDCFCLRADDGADESLWSRFSSRGPMASSAPTVITFSDSDDDEAEDVENKPERLEKRTEPWVVKLRWSQSFSSQHSTDLLQIIFQSCLVIITSQTFKIHLTWSSFLPFYFREAIRSPSPPPPESPVQKQSRQVKQKIRWVWSLCSAAAHASGLNMYVAWLLWWIITLFI